jgi:cardiolipin synthase (CMP-forming)
MIKFNRKFLYTLFADEKKLTIANMLTFIRILLVPFIVHAMVIQWWGAAFFLFITAALTDVADGFLARRYNEKSFFGACLDPVADKLLLLSCFFTLAFVQSPLFAIPGWFFAIVLIKEMVILGGSLLLLLLDCGFTVHPTMLGKATTVVQVSFITWLFACYFFHWLPIKTYYCMIGIMLCFVLLSCYQYLRIGLRYVMGKE